MTVMSLAFLAAMRLTPGETYALKWEPQKGEKTAFSMTFKSLDKQNPLEIESSLVQTVEKVDGDGYEAETENKGSLVRMGGEEIKDTRSTKTMVEFNKRGAVKEFLRKPNGPEGDIWLFAVLRTFIAPEKPVEIGGGWQYDYKPAGAFGGARISYTLKSVATGQATVAFTIGANDRSHTEIGKGEWKIDARTGQWRSMGAFVTGLFGSGEAGANVTLTRN